MVTQPIKREGTCLGSFNGWQLTLPGSAHCSQRQADYDGSEIKCTFPLNHLVDSGPLSRPMSSLGGGLGGGGLGSFRMSFAILDNS